MSNWEENLTELQEKIGYTFKSLTILKRALTTVSYAKENGLINSEHQEAYSTLGDAIQDVIVMNQAVLHGRSKKGHITNTKAIFAEEYSQALIAEGIGLGKYLRRGGGELFSIAPKIFSRCFESLMSAIFIDGGIESATNSFWKMYLGIHKETDYSENQWLHSMFITYNRIFGLEDDPTIYY